MMAKRIILKVLGTAVYIGTPLAVASKFFPLLTTETGEAEALGFSFITVFILILSIPVLNLVLKNTKFTFDLNWAWIIVTVFAGAFMIIAEQVFYIGLAGCAGMLVSQVLFKLEEAVAKQAETDKLATAVAEKLKETR